MRTQESRKQSVRHFVIKTLQYFHYFKHPLSMDEILWFLNRKVKKHDLQEVLQVMESNEDIFCYNGFYTLNNDDQFITRRIAGNALAAKKMKEARVSAAIISSFPFVQSVCVSGSLSKGYADDNSDIDFFIITKGNRLWICRSILHIYKKMTFLTGKQHSFCMNYFIDEKRLMLDEQNLFTATELATLIPMYNISSYNKLVGANYNWVKTILPNTKWNFDNYIQIKEFKFFKRATELLMNLFFPRLVNKVLMTITDKMWRYKWRKKDYPMADYDLAMKTNLYVSKNHPANHQKKVLNAQEKSVESQILVRA